MNDGNQLKRYRPYIIILIVVLLMELLLFNWRFFEGIGYESLNLENFTCGSGVEYVGTNQIKIKGDGDKWIEFQGFEAEVDNVYIDIRDKRNEDQSRRRNGIAWDYQRLSLFLSITDEANSQYMDMPERHIVEGVERTKYIKMHTVGESNKLKIRFNASDNQTLVLNAVTVNKQVPFSVSIVRIIFFYLLFAIAYLLRYGSPIYDIEYNAGSYGQIWAVIILAAANIILGGVISMTNPMFKDCDLEHHKQYNYLADSFIDGKIYLEYAEPPQALIDMENPYDKNNRDIVMRQNGAAYKWDHAYYNGKYYVYFGALPVLVYYMPYKLMTGEDFSTYTGVFLNISIFIVFAFLLLGSIIKKWFKNIPFVHYLLMTQVFILSSGIVFGMRRPDLYAMPITMALMFNVAGLYFWISAYECKTRLMQGIRLCVGSLCMALVAGCRPQFLLASFLAIPLFWGKVFKERELFSKKSAVHTLVFVLPYVIVAAVVMWYNYARFGSVFDFGATYNLTTNDMTRRGFNLGRVPLGFFAYFLQLPVTYGKFPFITGTNLSNTYMGTTIAEMMLGGILATQPLLWLIAFTNYLKKELKSKGIYVFIICSVVFSVIVAMADTQMAGILYRYYMDYSYLMLLPAILVAFTLFEKYRDKRLIFVVTLLCAICLCYDGALIFVQGDYSHDYSNPNFYYKITSALTFWL